MKSISSHRSEVGAIHSTTIMLIVMIVLFLIAGSLAIWGFVSADKASSNLNLKIDQAKAEAKREQAEEDEKKFAEREKIPSRQFVGAIDFGRVTFDYPKTWSSFMKSDGSKNQQVEAFLHPDYVLPTDGNENRFALRVLVKQQDYDEYLRQYDGLIKRGALTTAPTSANGHTGTRVEGDFKKDLRGALVVYKIRDKILVVQTDAPAYMPDFENIIKTINFNS